MPNFFAYIALIIWPIFGLVLYKRFEPVVATFLTILGGYLLLPVNVEFNFPLVPPLDKGVISSATALLACLYITRNKKLLFPDSGSERWLTIVVLISPLVTMLHNQEAIIKADILFEGLTYHDAISSAFKQYIKLIPFLLGIQLIKTYEDQLIVFKVLVISGLLYSLPILLEIRISPHLHGWVYGFIPHQFAQQMRYEGFRAIVFLGHGLLVSMFVAIVLGAAIALWKQRINILKYSYLPIAIYFLIVLILNKTFSGLLLGAFLMFAIALMPVFTQKRIALMVMLLVILYPFLSIFDLFPHQQVIDILADMDPDRAASLATRFHSETMMLENASEKVFFGWGGWGRSRVENSVTDGYWIILLGKYGLIGFISIFGLAAVSVWRGAKSIRFASSLNEQKLLAAHALIVSIIMVDQLPNSSLVSGFWMWFLIGALLGRANAVMKANVYAG